MSKTPYPALPQNCNEDRNHQRQFDLSLARTQYNYMFSYMEPLPIAASVPKSEAFTPDYFLEILKVFWSLADNFVDVVGGVLLEELSDDYSIEEIKVVRRFFRLSKDLKEASFQTESLSDLMHLLSKWTITFFQVPPAVIKQFFKGNKRLPKELFMMLKGLIEVFNQFRDEGFTAFLKSTLFEMLDYGDGREYLDVKDITQYKDLFNEIPLPVSLTIAPKPWMVTQNTDTIWDQDWYLGYLQIAGFNTTNLKMVALSKDTYKNAIDLPSLLLKMPLTDSLFQKVTGSLLTLEEAALQRRLFACDYFMLDGIPGGKLNGKKRFPVSPVGLFFWHDSPPLGYPSEGALQPIAIQINQQHDPETNPIYTPYIEESTDIRNNDHNGVKWRLAKLALQNACAVQHETVAHLGACHLVIDPMVIAANRQLHKDHPLLILLRPHFRYTLPINNGAINSLIVPGGVVSSVVSSTLEGSAQMIVDAHKQWVFDDQIPTKLFQDRGVGDEQLQHFPFREDTLDIWHAIHSYVKSYLSIYYGEDEHKAKATMLADNELQSWINEMVNSRCAAIKGMHGLTSTDNPEIPMQLDDFNYFVDVVSLIIYTASAQHASVNYAQYPLMTYIPSVSGTLYREAPTASELLEDNDYLSWLPPLDVALYQVSFGLLLSQVQYDQLGYYDKKGEAYFTDHNARGAVKEFQNKLKSIEEAIHQRNRSRAFKYEFQLPSKIPNSISI